MVRQQMVPAAGGSPRGSVSPTSLLSVRQNEDIISVVFHGSLQTDALSELRDVAFTALGARPRLLCMDIRQSSHIEIGVISTLVTIGRVARLVHVEFRVQASEEFVALLDETHLARHLPPLRLS